MYPFGYNGIDQTRKNKPQAYMSEPVDNPTQKYLDEFAQLYIENACALSTTRPVYLMRPIPEMRIDVPDVLSKEMLLGSRRDTTISLAEYRKRNDFVWRIQDMANERCGVAILDPLPYLCDDELCYGSRNGTPLYRDDNHLNRDGSYLLVPMFVKVIESAVAYSAVPNAQLRDRKATQP